MDLIKIIKERISGSVNVINMWVIDESVEHADHYLTPTSSPSHIRVTLVSNDFITISSLKRHRLIYKLLENEIKLLHAISLHLYTQDEYKRIEN